MRNRVVRQSVRPSRSDSPCGAAGSPRSRRRLDGRDPGSSPGQETARLNRLRACATVAVRDVRGERMWLRARFSATMHSSTEAWRSL